MARRIRYTRPGGERDKAANFISRHVRMWCDELYLACLSTTREGMSHEIVLLTGLLPLVCLPVTGNPYIREPRLIKRNEPTGGFT